MTAGREENGRAGAAVAAGEAAAAKHQVDAEAQHRISGSTVAVEPALTSDDIAVPWTGTDTGPGPGPSPQPSSSPNVSDPLDNSQSQ
jgi:hypothetical protein